MLKTLFQRHKHFLSLGLIIGVLGTGLLLALSPRPAHAAIPSKITPGGQAIMINAATIEYQGLYFYDASTADRTFQSDSHNKDFSGTTEFIGIDSNQCQHKIVVDANEGAPDDGGGGAIPAAISWTLHYTQTTDAPNGQCGNEQTAPLSTPTFFEARRYIYLYKDNQGEIQSIQSDQVHTYKPFATSKGKNVWLEADKTFDQCSSVITDSAHRQDGDPGGLGGWAITFTSNINGGEDPGVVSNQYTGLINDPKVYGKNYPFCQVRLEKYRNEELNGLGFPKNWTNGGNTKHHYASMDLGYTCDSCGDLASAALFMGGPENAGLSAVTTDPNAVAQREAQKKAGVGGGATSKNPKGQKVCTLGGSLSWLLCGAATLMQDTTDFISNSIFEPLLSVQPLTVTAGGGENITYTVWKNIRNIANIAFILAFFAIIFSQATSIGISNYGIKKMVPRLAAVAIGANLSFFICAGFVDAFNVFGIGMAQLLNSATIGKGSFASPGGSTAGGLAFIGISVAGLTALYFSQSGGTALDKIGGALISILGAVALIVVVAAITLLLRQVFIQALIDISALAFVAYLLPNTEQWFKKWWSLFIKLLAMFPIIMLLFASGHIFATILRGQTNLPAVFREPAAVGAEAIPLIGLPFSFALGGSIMGKLHKASSGRGKQILGALDTARSGTRGAKLRTEELGRRRQKAYLDRVSAPTGGGVRGRFARAGMRSTAFGGNKQYINEQLDSARRKLIGEQIGNTGAHMSVRAAHILANPNQNIDEAILNRMGIGGDGNEHQLADNDIEALRYVQTTGNARNHIGATAAALKLIEADDMSVPDMQNFVAQANAQGYGNQFIDAVDESAMKSGAKHFAYGDLVNGQYDQYNRKPGGALGVVKSGLSGIKKEALDDPTLKAAIRTHVADANQVQRVAKVEAIARQTLHIDKAETINRLAQTVGMRSDDFMALRDSLRSGPNSPSFDKSKIPPLSIS